MARLGSSGVYHLNVNCSDLDRSLRFYRDLLGLTPGIRTAPLAPQPGRAFGLDRAQWDAWILHDDRGIGSGVVLDLLEWRVPRPTGTPVGADHLGFSRLGLLVADLDGLHGRLAAAGIRTFGAPRDVGASGSVRAVVACDPDGTLVELVESRGEHAVPATRLAFVVIGCSDLERSTAFYRDVLGFATRSAVPRSSASGAALGLAGTVEHEAAFLDDPRRDGTFTVELVRWHSPSSPEPPPTNGNHLGIWRMAMLTDDLDGDHDALVTRGVRCYGPPVALDMGPDIPPLRALMFADPDGTTLELIEPPR